MDGNLAYNPSTGTVTATIFKGNIDAVDGDFDGTLEADAMTLNGTAITATATLDTGISNNNVPKFTSGVADNDFLRVDGTAIEGRSASEVLSDIAAAPAAGSSNIVTTGALNSGSITSGFGSIDNGSSAITTTGVITGGTLEATADTSAGDNAAIGYTAAEGLILTGQGSTSDITLKNDADATVFTVPTGTDDILFPDGAKVIFGAGSDFSINHDSSDGNLFTLAANPLEIHQAGTNSVLQLYKDTGDGILLTFFGGSTSRGSITTDTNLLTMSAVKDFKVRVNNGEIAADFLADGAVNLYHDTGLRFSTTADGVDIAGDTAITGHASIGVDAINSARALTVAGATDGSSSSILVLYNSSLASKLSVRDDGFVDIAGNMQITTAANDVQLTLKSTDADANVGPVIDMIRDSSSPADGDELGRIRFKGDDDAGNETTYAYLQVKINDAGDGSGGSEDGELEIFTRQNANGRSRMKFGFDSTQAETVFNEGSQDIDFRVESDANANCFYVDAGNDHVLFGKTATNSDNAGFEVLSNGSIAATRSSGHAALFNRLSDNGAIINLRKDGTTIGIISTYDSDLAIGTDNAGLRFINSTDANAIRIAPSNVGGGTDVDDSIDLGYSAARFDDIFATNGTIQTSDENEKQNIASLTSAEIAAAKAISALFKTFKWKSKVTAKGDAARTHTGVIAQEVQTAMSAAGLDATKYAFWCSDTWWETTTEVSAVEADKDADIEAQDAYTRTHTYDTEEEAPEGAIKRTRLGVRYPELLAFIGAATEQRLADIETRLAALEAG
jgi:hypothetical protein